MPSASIASVTRMNATAACRGAVTGAPARRIFRITVGNTPTSADGWAKPSAGNPSTRALNTSKCNSKCVKPCRTLPARSHSASAGAWATASAAVHGASRHGVPGSSGIPPSRPLGGRNRSSTRSDRSVSQNAAPCRSGRARLAAFGGSVSAIPASRPAQTPDHGQIAQAGLRGVQMVAPRSNSACAKSDGRATASGSRPSWSAAAATAAAEGSVAMANRRETTRSTLPSTGTTGTPNAIAATARAV